MSRPTVREAPRVLASNELVNTADQRNQMCESVQHHDEVSTAIRRRGGANAARLDRERLYSYYCDYIDEEERPGLRALLHEYDHI